MEDAASYGQGGQQSRIEPPGRRTGHLGDMCPAPGIQGGEGDRGVVCRGWCYTFPGCCWCGGWKERILTADYAQYADKMYGIKGVHDAEKKEGEEDEDEDDIEAAIKKEVEALNANRKGTDGGHNMTPLKMNVDCLMFVKTKPPIDPVAFVRRIVEDAKSAKETGQMKCRYVNRLTPVSVTGKATEQGLEGVAREALAPFFDLTGKKTDVDQFTEAAAKPAAETEAGSEKASNENAQPAEKGFTVSCFVMHAIVGS